MIEFHRYRISGCTNTIENMDAKIFVERCVPFPFFPDQTMQSDEITLFVTWNICVLLLIIILDSIRLDTIREFPFHAFFHFSFFFFFYIEQIF